LHHFDDDGIVVFVWFVYLARCADGSLYVGRTRDLATREKAHNDGDGAAYTAARRPVCIVYAEQHCSAKTAAGRERQVKRWTAQKKEALVSGRVRALKELGERQSVHKKMMFTWKDLLKRLSQI
jgi:putative endonuclease